jgi:hypothetical protein
MADPENDPRPGDIDNVLLQKILKRLPTISGGGGGSGSGLTDAELRASAVAVSGPLTDAQIRASALPVSGPLTDTQIRASALPVSAASLPLPSGASTEVTLAALSAKVTAVNTGAVVLAAGAAAIGSVSVTGSVTVTGPLTDTQLRATAVPVSGNLGGKMAVIKDTTVVSTSPTYTSGDAVGAKRTLANALTSIGTGVLESITVLDRANQKATLEIFIFDADPTNATITDNAAFVFSTDDLKVLARIEVGPSDYVTINSKAVATIKGIGVALKAAGTSLYVVVVTTDTPTYAATTDLQLIFGILQD